MKAVVLLSLGFVGISHAFMHFLEQAAHGVSGEKATKRQTPPFDPSVQYVDITGDHAFVAPGEGDQRGPCPGLNAMANHGYLPHNGVATITEFVEKTGQVFGMGVDLATLLATYGAVFDGDLISWSIGGPTPLISLTGLLGEPQGISGSHNNYEGDGSATRGDLYQYGNDYLLQLSEFQGLYDLGKADDNYDLDVLSEYRATRFQQSIDNNPYFFYAPFAGIVAQPGAWLFINQLMSNKSAEYPEGRLTGDVLKTFFSITGDDGNFTYTPGYERIPENWYKRHPSDPYTIASTSLDATTTMLLRHLEFGSIGGNTGTTNSFVGLAPENLTGGVYSATTLTQGNNLLCYGLELTIQQTPDILSGLFTDISAAEDKIGSVLNNVTDSLGCPKLNNIDKDQFQQFPGYTQSYDGYKDPTKGGIL